MSTGTLFPGSLLVIAGMVGLVEVYDFSKLLTCLAVVVATYGSTLVARDLSR